MQLQELAAWGPGDAVCDVNNDVFCIAEGDVLTDCERVWDCVSEGHLMMAPLAKPFADATVLTFARRKHGAAPL